MAQVKLFFYGTEKSKTDLTELEASATDENEIYISIYNQRHLGSYICLDKSTAIRLVRELKKQIGIIMESEGNNG